MIREAGINDIPAIRAMAQVAFRDTYKDILSHEQMEYMMDWMYSEPSLLRQMTVLGHRFLIEEGKGYASFRFQEHMEDGVDLFHLEKLYVMPACQGTGLGRRLFNEVAGYARRASSRKIRIELNVNRYNKAVGFYEHLGMHKSSSGDFPIGNGFYMNDYIMTISFV